MIRNPKLISHAKVVARNRKTDEILALVEKYEVACELSLGPDSSRSKAWEQKASERRNALCSATGYED